MSRTKHCVLVAAAIIDFMPPADGANLVRIVSGESGRVTFQTEFVVRFNYGARKDPEFCS
jgi:hypothetical protein